MARDIQPGLATTGGYSPGTRLMASPAPQVGPAEESTGEMPMPAPGANPNAPDRLLQPMDGTMDHHFDNAY